MQIRNNFALWELVSRLSPVRPGTSFGYRGLVSPAVERTLPLHRTVSILCTILNLRFRYLPLSETTIRFDYFVVYLDRIVGYVESYVYIDF